jgi:GTP-binding protein
MKVIDARFISTSTEFKELSKVDAPEVMFLGRSNVGKSSLINTLLNRKNLAYVSKKPGKTRTINLYEVLFYDKDKNKNSLIIADLPGYGYAEVSQREKRTWQILIEEYASKRASLCGAIIVVDIRYPLDEKDVQAIAWVCAYDLPYLIVATKGDKIGNTKLYSNIKMPGQGKYNICAFSSKTRLGMENVLTWLEEQVHKFYRS